MKIQADLFPVLIENTWCFLKTNICLFFYTSIKSIQYVIVKIYIILCIVLGLHFLQGDFQPSCFQRPCFFHFDGLWRDSYKTVCTPYSLKTDKWFKKKISEKAKTSNFQSIPSSPSFRKRDCKRKWLLIKDVYAHYQKWQNIFLILRR